MTFLTHSAPAMASWIIDMWVGNMYGSCHSVWEYAQVPIAGTLYWARSEWMDADAQLV